MNDSFRIFYFTTVDKTLQGDFQECSTLIGLRSLLGDRVIDYPRKKVLYGDFSESPKEKLHGGGFTLYTRPIKDISNRDLNITKDDFILFGVTDAYGIPEYKELTKLTPNVFFLDGHDDNKIRRTPCFKRELFEEHENVWPTGFGIPHWCIRPLDLAFKNKKKLIQKNAPDPDLMDKYGTVPKIHFHKTLGGYLFSKEEDYYNDISESWFGITTLRGGWDSLRTYEIAAAGTLVIFKDYDKKPPLCSPQNFPCFTYSSVQELDGLMNSLVVDGKPTRAYVDMLWAQRGWLVRNGTCEARAGFIIETMLKNAK